MFALFTAIEKEKFNHWGRDTIKVFLLLNKGKQMQCIKCLSECSGGKIVRKFGGLVVENLGKLEKSRKKHFLLIYFPTFKNEGILKFSDTFL